MRGECSRRPPIGHLRESCCPTCGRTSERSYPASRKPEHALPQIRAPCLREFRSTLRDSTGFDVNRQADSLGEGVVWRSRGPRPAPQAAQMGSGGPRRDSQGTGVDRIATDRPQHQLLSQTVRAPAPSPLARLATSPASKPDSSGSRPMTYAAMVAPRIPRGDDTSKGGRPTTKGRPNLGCPIDPLRQGRCLHCLVRGHTAHDCRDPIRCRLCRQARHRQTSCPYQQAPRLDSAGTGLFACLLGELHDADPS